MQRTSDQEFGAEIDGVRLPHGIARSARSLDKMERALRMDGYLTLNLDYPWRGLRTSPKGWILLPRSVDLVGDPKFPP